MRNNHVVIMVGGLRSRFCPLSTIWRTTNTWMVPEPVERMEKNSKIYVAGHRVCLEVIRNF